jgi:hypothetical protein
MQETMRAGIRRRGQMKTVIKAGAITAAILTLTVCTAKCALMGDDVRAVELARITAPTFSARADEGTQNLPPIEKKPLATTEKEDVQNSVYDALELMYDTPLRAEVQLEIEALCAARDVDAAVVLAIIYHESRYVEDAVNPTDESFGLMQILRRCHEDRMARLGVTDLLDGVENVRIGVDYLDELLDKYGGDYYKALTAYNRGHYGGEVSRYAYKVMEEAARLCSE